MIALILLIPILCCVGFLLSQILREVRVSEANRTAILDTQKDAISALLIRIHNLEVEIIRRNLMDIQRQDAFKETLH